MNDIAAETLAKATELLAQAATLADIEELRVRYLGRKGVVAGMMANIPQLPAEARPAAGRAANELKRSLSELVEAARTRIAQQQEAAVVCTDPTLPGIRPPLGHIHPVSQTIEETADI
ncbi:MAG: phenylalanine--tRNA ligase subunit alpha, partial [Planctomycetota bacterium]